MITISYFNPLNHEFDKEALERAVGETLLEHGHDSASLTIAFVDKKQMGELVKKHYKKSKKEHSVLSFPTSEMSGEFIFPPGKTTLGEIVIAPSIAQKLGHDVFDLVKHSCLHLVGIHH